MTSDAFEQRGEREKEWASERARMAIPTKRRGEQKLKNSRLYTHTATRVIIGVAYTMKYIYAAAAVYTDSKRHRLNYTYYHIYLSNTLMPISIYTEQTHIRAGPRVLRAQ